MSEIPAEVRRLVEERAAARAARDFARADALREEIVARGFEVIDAPGRSDVRRRARYDRMDPARAPSFLEGPPSLGFSIHLLYEGFLSDVARFLAGLEAHCRGHDYEVLLVDNGSNDADALEDLAAEHPEVSVLHLDRTAGWAEARNAGLRRSRGAVVVIADLSVEPTGDVLAPLATALGDPGVGIAGPFGVTSEDLHHFEGAAGPEVDAIEGYLLAMRRETVAAGAMFREQFKWYRNADLDLSFEVRSRGLSAVAASCPVARHEHRGWGSLDEEERAKASKRNFYRFYDRWKHRHDLLLSHHS